MEKVSLIKKRETLKELAHEDVYTESGYIGYLIKNSPLVSDVLKWHFVSRDVNVPNLKAETKEELLELVEGYV